MSDSAENSMGDQPQPPQPSAPRPHGSNSPQRKEALLAQINELAIEGFTCREIGRKLKIGKSTVNRWLKELRREQSNSVFDEDQMTLNAVARYNSIYREAMQAWRNSKADKQVRIVENTEVAGLSNGLKEKVSVRTEARPGEIGFLAQARDAVDKICKLMEL